MKRTIIALLVLMLLSSCSANATADTSEALTALAPTPTVTPLPTFTPTPKPTATATPTEVPLTPKETEAMKYDLAATPEEAMNILLPLDFVEKGGPGLTAKLKYPVTFPETAKPGGDIVLRVLSPEPFSVLEWSPEAAAAYLANPETAPQKIVGYATTMGEDTSGADQLFMVVVHAWLNPDKEIKYLSYIYHMGTWGITPKDAMSVVVDYRKDCKVQPTCTIVRDKTINDLLRSWAEKDFIPDGLEDHAIAGNNG
jgi:hypothetical protein